MQFYDIHEQTPYEITISKPANPEELSDLFITEEEVKDLIGGGNFYCHDKSPRTVVLRNVVTNEIKKWGDKLEASGMKTLKIEDEELLDVVKKGYLSDYIEDSKYGRHGDRICFARQFKRVKKKPTNGDVNDLWNHMMIAFKFKYGCYPSHIPRYDRSITMFKAWKKITGWRAVCKSIGGSPNRKFHRLIWDNPEEYI